MRLAPAPIARRSKGRCRSRVPDAKPRGLRSRSAIPHSTPMRTSACLLRSEFERHYTGALCKSLGSFVFAASSKAAAAAERALRCDRESRAARGCRARLCAGSQITHIRFLRSRRQNKNHPRTNITLDAFKSLVLKVSILNTSPYLCHFDVLEMHVRL